MNGCCFETAYFFLRNYSKHGSKSESVAVNVGDGYEGLGEPPGGGGEFQSEPKS